MLPRMYKPPKKAFIVADWNQFTNKGTMEETNLARRGRVATRVQTTGLPRPAEIQRSPITPGPSLSALKQAFGPYHGSTSRAWQRGWRLKVAQHKHTVMALAGLRPHKVCSTSSSPRCARAVGGVKRQTGAFLLAPATQRFQHSRPAIRACRQSAAPRPHAHQVQYAR